MLIIRSGNRNKFKEKRKDFLNNIFQIYKDLCQKNWQKCRIPLTNKIERTMARNLGYENLDDRPIIIFTKRIYHNTLNYYL